MGRPNKPTQFRKLTPREHIALTPRDRPLPIPSPDILIAMLDVAVQFSTTRSSGTIEALKIWWKFTTEYKTRENFLRQWILNNELFMSEYAAWRITRYKDASEPVVHFGEDPNNPPTPEPPLIDED